MALKKKRPVVHTQEDFMVGDNDWITSQWEHRNPPPGFFLLRMDNTQDPSFHSSNNELFKKSEGRKKLKRKIDKEKKKKGNMELEKEVFMSLPLKCKSITHL